MIRPESLRHMVSTVAGLGVCLLAGCDPCLGSGACGDPRLLAEGQLIWLVDGSPAEGVVVEFRPAASSSLALDTLRTTSSAQGIFRFDAAAERSGTAEGTLVFFPPNPYPQFVLGVDGIRIPTVRVSGDRFFVGSWGVGPVRTAPHISYVGELFFRDSGLRAEGVEVEFRRTGGIQVEPDTFVVHSDVAGRFPLLMTPTEEGEVEGEIIIRPPPPYRPFTVEGIRMATLIGKDDIRLIDVWAIDE